jgi:hypothetical protein
MHKRCIGEWKGIAELDRSRSRPKLRDSLRLKKDDNQPKMPKQVFFEIIYRKIGTLPLPVV